RKEPDLVLSRAVRGQEGQRFSIGSELAATGWTSPEGQLTLRAGGDVDSIEVALIAIGSIVGMADRDHGSPAIGTQLHPSHPNKLRKCFGVNGRLRVVGGAAGQSKPAPADDGTVHRISPGRDTTAVPLCRAGMVILTRPEIWPWRLSAKANVILPPIASE